MKDGGETGESSDGSGRVAVAWRAWKDEAKLTQEGVMLWWMEAGSDCATTGVLWIGEGRERVGANERGCSKLQEGMTVVRLVVVVVVRWEEAAQGEGVGAGVVL